MSTTKEKAAEYIEKNEYRKFKNKNGSLTKYALACGYVQTKQTNNGERTLWHENACFHVRQHNHETGERIFWYSGNLTNCRKVFNSKNPLTTIEKLKDGIAT